MLLRIVWKETDSISFKIGTIEKMSLSSLVNKFLIVCLDDRTQSSVGVKLGCYLLSEEEHTRA